MSNNCPMLMPCLPSNPTCTTCQSRAENPIQAGAFVLRKDRPDLGVGEVVESLSAKLCRVAFPCADEGSQALVVNSDELRHISTEEARGRVYLAN